MTKPHVPWLLQLAQASVTAEDILSGVLGDVHIEGLRETRSLQSAVYDAGWTRCRDLEEDACFSNKIEYRVFSKLFAHGRRWITLTASVCLGVFCDLQSFDMVP